MTSGFSTIAGSVMTAYISLGVPPVNLVTSSVMSIPASIAISKMRLPELEEPVTRGRVTVDRGDEKRPVCAFIFTHTKPSLIILRKGKCSSRVQSRCCLWSHRCWPNFVGYSMILIITR
jgi:hypothetical protein